MTNIAYILGIDGVSFNATTRQFQPINRASAYVKKNRIHVNKILPTIQNRLARLCKNPPRYDVRPESNDTEDKEAARLAVQILGAFWEKLALNKKRIPLYMWTQQAGHAWLKVGWDPTLGEPLVENGEVVGYQGDVRVDICSGLEIFPNPTAKSEEEVLATDLIQCKVRTLDYFRNHYPKGNLVKAEDAWLISAQYESKINSMNSRGPSSGGMQDQMKNSAIEMIKYEARSKKYPHGRMIVCANGILLEDKPLPIGEIPFALFEDIPIGGKLMAEAIITHLRPIQDQYNETIRKRADWTNKLLTGKLKAPRGADLSQESLNDQSGEVVYYNVVPNAPSGPEPIQMPSIPQYAYQEEDRLIDMFNDISGEQEIDRGDIPSAGIPAIGMQLLTEKSDTRIGIETESHEHSWARTGSLILKHFEVGYEMPRKLKFAGKNSEYLVKEVSGQDIRGNTDVIVIRGSTLPGSKTLKRQEILNAFGQGLLGDPADSKVREKVLSMIEFGDVAEMWQDLAIDQSQIKRGIEMIEAGMPPRVDEMDNHPLWIQELNRYRKTDKWEALDPEKQAILKATIEAHLQAVVKLSNAVPPLPPDDSMPIEEGAFPPAAEGNPLPPPPGAEPPPELAAEGLA